MTTRTKRRLERWLIIGVGSVIAVVEVIAILAVLGSAIRRVF